MNTVRIVVADDHLVVREGLRVWLGTENHFSLVGVAEDGQAALNMVHKHKPDVLVVDISMPGMNGLEVTRRVVSEFPGTRVVVLSMHHHETYVQEALRLGALAYVLKDETQNDLVDAVWAAVRGERFLSRRLPIGPIGVAA